MLLPGGGWQPNPTAYRSEMPTAAQLQQLGVATVVVGYGEGGRASGSQQVYLQARKRIPACRSAPTGSPPAGTWP